MYDFNWRYKQAKGFRRAFAFHPIHFMVIKVLKNDIEACMRNYCFIQVRYGEMQNSAKSNRTMPIQEQVVNFIGLYFNEQFAYWFSDLVGLLLRLWIMHTQVRLMPGPEEDLNFIIIKQKHDREF